MKQTNRLGEFKRIQKVLVISSKRSVRDSLPITRNLPRAPKFFPCLPLKVSSAKELSDQPVQQRFCFTFFHGFFLCSHWFIFVHPFHHYPLNVYNRLCSRRFYASLGFFSGKWYTEITQGRWNLKRALGVSLQPFKTRWYHRSIHAARTARDQSSWAAEAEASFFWVILGFKLLFHDSLLFYGHVCLQMFA